MNIVLTSFLTATVDPQRGERLAVDKELLQPLIQSCKKNGVKVVVLNDCFEESTSDDVDFVRVAPGYNPYFYRWEIQKRYLEEHPEIKNAYMVDATDVEMQFNPFISFDPKYIYVGDECEEVGCEWMVQYSSGYVKTWVLDNRSTLLLNCGVIGSSAETLIEVCTRIMNAYPDISPGAEVEMPIFNMVLRTQFNHKLIRGRQITTLFKNYQNDDRAFFKHK